MAVIKDYREFVLVSRSVLDWVDIPSEVSPPVHIEEDVCAGMFELMRKHPGVPINLIVFVDAADLVIIINQLTDLRSERVLYTFVAVTELKDLSTITYDPCDMLALRTTRITGAEFSFLVKKGCIELAEQLARKSEEIQSNLRLLDAWNDQESLIYIGKSLSLEKNPDRLLRTILYFSKKITGADAGSIFIIEGENNEKKLRFKYSHTFSMDLAYESFTLPLDTSSIAGYVAVTGKVLNIPDVYKLDEHDPVSFNPSFDKSHGYRTKSMLVLPMRNHIDEIIGVIQLINSKEISESYTGNEAYEVLLENPQDFEEKVAPFKKRYESLMEAVAGQAATALENNRMLLQIEQQFEEFVKASVSAIESRDPATSGHSFRVAEMCVNMARIINATTEGPFKDVEFADYQIKELEFAGLLHDFGKVYISPEIFQKEKKLYPQDYRYLMMRLKFLYRSLELTCARVPSKEQKLSSIRRIMDLVTELNEPRVRTDDPWHTIQNILDMEDDLCCGDLDGKPIPLLEQPEVVNLKISRGSLNEYERRIIESHVEHTYTFVSKIPWPEEYRNIPEIARKHHEKLDGSGYPLGLRKKEEIPLGARIMAIADIFDALSATDRPYKRAVTYDEIFTILREEVRQGKLDGELVELFIEKKGWKIGTGKTEKQEQFIDKVERV